VLPSARVSDAARRPDATSADASALRRTGHTLRGELDAIVMMCLRPEPDRRYTSAAELGRDLQRWLEGRTVLARPDTLRYRTTMFVRRNRIATAALTVAVVALVTSTIVSLRQANIARRERDRARVEQVRTERVATFFQQVLNDAVPRRGGRALTVSEALTRAIPIIDTAFTREADLKAAVQLSLGSTLQNLEQPERARPLLIAAYDYFRRHDGATASRDQTDALWDLAALARSDGKLAEAESLYVRLAAVYRQPGHAANDPVQALLRIAGLRVDAGDLPGAIAAYDSLVPQLAVRTRDDSLDLAANLGSRGVALTALGRFDRATTDLARALRLNETLLGPDNFAIGQVLQPYAAAMLFTGKVAAAESLARRALVISRREYGDGTAATLSAARMLGTVLVSAGRCAEAVRVFTDILSHRGTALPDSDPTVGYALAHRGFCRAESGDVRGGISDAREALPLSAAAVGTQHYAYHLAQSLAGAAIGRGPGSDRAEGARLLQAGADGLRRTLDPAHARVREANERLAAFQRRLATR
jgi:tetratricopeptide (TPR) repeat protein